jgi:hypothetical protein
MGASDADDDRDRDRDDDERDEDDDEYEEYDPEGVPPMVELGQYPRLSVLVLRRRLESAGITTMVEWTGPNPEALGTLLVPEPQSEFAEAVVNELDVDDEVPDTSPAAYLARIEEHLSAIGGLLEELRARVDELEQAD